jgi:ABC-type bacteriocin/lantibiotic exporter with double-glycine peptidase domain
VRTSRFARVNLFFYSAIVFLVINASICATFAGVYDRYQGRVAWIIPFSLTAYVGCFAWDWKPWMDAKKIVEKLEAGAD